VPKEREFYRAVEPGRTGTTVELWCRAGLSREEQEQRLNYGVVLDE
jgi:hypothetical protein